MPSQVLEFAGETYNGLLMILLRQSFSKDQYNNSRQNRFLSSLHLPRRRFRRGKMGLEKSRAHRGRSRRVTASTTKYSAKPPDIIREPSVQGVRA